MQIAAWVVFCVVAAGLLHARPGVMVAAALCLWTFLPGVAASLITGRSTGTVAYHPASWFVLCCLVVLLIRHPEQLLTELARRWALYLTMLFAVLAATIMTKMGPQPPGVVIIVDQVLVPVIMFWIASAAFRSRPESVLMLRTVVIALAAVQSLLALTQWAFSSILIFHQQFLVNYWFTPAWNRWMGTTDHPLVLSMLLCAAIPLVAGLRRPLVQIPLLTLMSVATLITQSRTAAVLVPIALLYVVFRSHSKPGAKLAIGAVITAAALALLASPLTSGLASRLNNDTGSTQARGQALDFFLGHWQQYLFSGNGITTSYQVARIGGLNTSLESAYLMYAVGVGIVVATIYFGAQLVIVLGSVRTSRLRGALLSAVMVLVIPETFSSLGVDTLCGPLLWVVLALAASGSAVRATTQGRRSNAVRQRPCAARATVRPTVPARAQRAPTISS